MTRLYQLFIGLGICLTLSAIFGLNTLHAQGMNADIVVAQDGSGDFTTIQAAIDAVPDNSDLHQARHL